MRQSFRQYTEFRRGQSLIEVIVAFAVAVVIGVGLVTASLATQKASANARNQSQATKLAQEYLEQVRVIRDVEGWPTFSAHEGCFSVNSVPRLVDLSVSCSSSLIDGESVPLNNVTYHRDISIGVTTANTKTIIVTVSWAEGINTNSTSAHTILSKWCEGNVSAGDC